MSVLLPTKLFSELSGLSYEIFGNAVVFQNQLIKDIYRNIIKQENVIDKHSQMGRNYQLYLGVKKTTYMHQQVVSLGKNLP